MRHTPLPLLIIVLGFCSDALAQKNDNPYQTAQWSIAPTRIDEIVSEYLIQNGAELAPPASDATFVRRVYIDLIGTLPTREEVLAFLQSDAPDKRRALIDELMQRDRFADFCTLRWCDTLRLKSEYPINLWPNAVQAYHRWIHDALKENRPCDVFAHELLTASGSNFRQANANFYRAAPSQAPRDLAAAVSIILMGIPFESWTPETQENFARIFQQVSFKKTSEWKEEIVYWDTTKTSTVHYVFPDGTALSAPAEQDIRSAFASWLTSADNPWFAKNIVNRIWYWVNGYGLMLANDDISAATSAPIPELVRYLENELISSNFDMRHVYRLILNSRVYQQSSVANEQHHEHLAFASYKIRRIEAEVLIDALGDLTGERERYSSPIPEPFTFIPKNARAIELADGSITNQALELFGRPSRDSGRFEERSEVPSDAQRLYLLNSTDMHNRLRKAFRAGRQAGNSPQALQNQLNGLYLRILSRHPTANERETLRRYLENYEGGNHQAIVDVAWALINSKEFIYKH